MDMEVLDGLKVVLEKIPNALNVTIKETKTTIDVELMVNSDANSLRVLLTGFNTGHYGWKAIVNPETIKNPRTMYKHGITCTFILEKKDYFKLNVDDIIREIQYKICIFKDLISTEC